LGADDLPKPDFKLTAEELEKEYKADRKAFAKKYQDKVVELTGVVDFRRISHGDVLLIGTEKTGTISVAPKSDFFDQFRALSKGQSITVLATVGEKNVLSFVSSAVIVKKGPSTAIPVTLTMLQQELKKNPKAALEKYKDNDLIFMAKIVESESRDKRSVYWTLTEPKGKSAIKIKAKAADSFGEEKVLKEWESHKVGDVLMFIGQLATYGDVPEFSICNPIKELPEGIKLPGDKK
jgi:hypothetical protein